MKLSFKLKKKNTKKTQLLLPSMSHCQCNIYNIGYFFYVNRPTTVSEDPHDDHDDEPNDGGEHGEDEARQIPFNDGDTPASDTEDPHDDRQNDGARNDDDSRETPLNDDGDDTAGSDVTAVIPLADDPGSPADDRVVLHVQTSE